MRRRPRGMTLLEVLVASAVGLIALISTFTAFWPAHDFFLQANQTSGLYAQAMTVLDRMAVEIEESGPWLVQATASNPPVLALPSARDAANLFHRDEQGKPAWRKWILYYVCGEASGLCLVRREAAATFPPETSPWAIPPGLLTPPDQQSRVVCRNLSLFQASARNTASGLVTCRVELVLSLQTRHPAGADKPLTHTARFQRTAITRNAE